MKPLRLFVFLVSLATLSACHTTRVNTGLTPSGPQVERRQWFTLAGLVPLSDPAGQECPNGLATSESAMSGTDFLINVGLSLVGGVAGAMACSPEMSLTCASSFSTLVPALASSRTLTYTCAGPR